jgi:hypothetical protein
LTASVARPLILWAIFAALDTCFDVLIKARESTLKQELEFGNLAFGSDHDALGAVAFLVGLVLVGFVEFAQQTAYQVTTILTIPDLHSGAIDCRTQKIGDYYSACTDQKHVAVVFERT